MNGLQLIATGGALPGRTVTNEELSRTVDTLPFRPLTPPQVWPVRCSGR